MCASFSPELTLLPRRAPHELRSQVEAKALAAKVNRYLRRTKGIASLMMAKADPHLYHARGGQSYLIEITPLPGCPFDTDWVRRDSTQWPVFKAGIDALFAHLKADCGLVPTLVTHRQGRPIHWPGGGCHLHYGADLFSMHSDWYSTMERFHRNLVVDYANRPYLRWLFSQWFVNEEGSTAPLSLKDYQRPPWPRSWAWTRPTVDTVFDTALRQSKGIEARFMATSKASYLTFEFRLFSMVRDAEQLGAIARFTHAWVQSLVSQTLRGETVPLTISPSNLRSYATLRGSRRACEDFLDSLGLPWQDYSQFYDVHYANRIRYGKMV